MTREKIAAAVLAILVLFSSTASASPASRQRTREAFDLAYALKFGDAYAAFKAAASIDANDPAPLRGIASLLWMEALFAQGAATFEAFTGQVSSKSDVARPAVPAAIAEDFRDHIGRATTLGERRLQQSPDADGYYQVGATAALSAIYAATVEGRTFGSFAQARRAVRMMERARALEPRWPEPALVLGMSRYTVSTMSRPVRMLATIAGLPGGREEGIDLLEQAANAGSATEADALVVLMIIYNREGEHGRAITSLARLQARFPTNRLLALNRGVTALAARQFEVAERTLATAIQNADFKAGAAVLGEDALWYLKLGTARAALGRMAEARSDLGKVLTLNARDWVRGRAHLELGSLELKLGNRDAARRHVDTGLMFSRRGRDEGALRELQALSVRAQSDP